MLQLVPYEATTDSYKNITTSYYIKILIIIMSTYCTRGTRATLLVSLKEASKLKAGRMITKRTKLGFHSFGLAVFSFLYFLKIKISKIYVRFEIFQKYTPVALL